MKNTNTSYQFLFSQGKDKKYIPQYKAVFEAFFESPSTMKQVSVKTGIDRANICRYCRCMRKNGIIKVFKKIICPITKHKANALTTNPSLFPISKQLQIWK